MHVLLGKFVRPPRLAASVRVSLPKLEWRFRCQWVIFSGIIAEPWNTVRYRVRGPDSQGSYRVRTVVARTQPPHQPPPPTSTRVSNTHGLLFCSFGGESCCPCRRCQQFSIPHAVITVLAWVLHLSFLPSSILLLLLLLLLFFLIILLARDPRRPFLASPHSICVFVVSAFYTLPFVFPHLAFH
ncbi:hypothetical protein BJX64DRAFT_10405 [Aspergillus heterothallicus]